MDWKNVDLVEPKPELVTAFSEQWKKNLNMKKFREACKKFGMKDINDTSHIFQTIFKKNHIGDDRIRNIYKRDHKPNDMSDEDYVLFKVLLLDKLYGTQIEDPIAMAKYITEEHICIPPETEVENIDLDIVNRIASYDKNKRREYSFATKYCHWHNSNYPIYDDIIAHMLLRYNQQFEFYDGAFYLNSTKTDRKSIYTSYEDFYEIYNSFRTRYLSGKDFKDIDIFLWTYGKVLVKNAEQKKVKKPQE